MSPLFTASKSGHTEVVEFLLSHGADMEIRDNVRRTGYCALAKPYNSKHATQKITYYILYMYMYNTECIHVCSACINLFHSR